MIERPSNPLGFDMSLVFDQINLVSGSASGADSFNLSRALSLNFLVILGCFEVGFSKYVSSSLAT